MTDATLLERLRAATEELLRHLAISALSEDTPLGKAIANVKAALTPQAKGTVAFRDVRRGERFTVAVDEVPSPMRKIRNEFGYAAAISEADWRVNALSPDDACILLPEPSGGEGLTAELKAWEKASDELDNWKPETTEDRTSLIGRINRLRHNTSRQQREILSLRQQLAEREKEGKRDLEERAEAGRAIIELNDALSAKDAEIGELMVREKNWTEQVWKLTAQVAGLRGALDEADRYLHTIFAHETNEAFKDTLREYFKRANAALSSSPAAKVVEGWGIAGPSGQPTWVSLRETEDEAWRAHECETGWDRTNAIKQGMQAVRTRLVLGGK